MNNILKAILFLIFYNIVEVRCTVKNFLTLIENVQNFYLTPSVVIVYDKHQFDLRRQKILLEIILSRSARNSMSQAITYDELTQSSKRRENALYSLVIHDHESLEHAISATKDTDMSAHPWLLIFNQSSHFDCNQPGKDFFKLRMDTKMTAICEGSNVLKRYYSIFENQTEVIDLADWTPENKLEFKDRRSLMKAERDMKGITLRLATKYYNLPDNETIRVDSKFSFELMEELKNLSNFKTKVVEMNNELGYYNSETDQWYGLMKTMHDQLADIALALFSMSDTRMKVVDYAIPLAKGQCNLYAKLPDDTLIHYTAYFKVFNQSAWTAIGLSILMFSILVCIMKNGFQRISTNKFFEDFIIILGIFSQQGFNETFSRNSIKIVYFSILLSSMLLNAIYSASITSYITVLSADLPFLTYDEFKRDTSYQVTVVKGSRDQSLILSNNSRLTPLKHRLKKDHLLPVNSYEGFHTACQEKTAFYTDEVKYDSMQDLLPCKLGKLDMERVEYQSFVMTKNSPYKRTINNIILRLTDHGILKRLRDKHFRKFDEIPDTQPSVISIGEVWSILIIWLVGLIIAVIQLIVEIIVFKCSNAISSTKINDTSPCENVSNDRRSFDDKKLRMRANLYC